MATAPDVGKALMANSEFGRKLDAMFAELVSNKALSSEAGVSLSGMTAQWAAVNNMLLTEIMSEIATKDNMLRLQRDEIVEMFGKICGEKGGNIEDDEGKSIKRVNEKNGKDHVPDKWSGKTDKTTFKETREKIYNWTDAVFEDGIAMLKKVEERAALN